MTPILIELDPKVSTEFFSTILPSVSNSQSRHHLENVPISGQTINAAISGRSVNGSLTILLFLDLHFDSDVVLYDFVLLKLKGSYSYKRLLAFSNQLSI